MNLKRFTDKGVIVTGGASGIGAACIRRFHAEGAKVLIADIEVAAGEALAAELGEGAFFHETDVSEYPAIDAMVAAALDQMGSIDVLMNNAALGSFRPDADVPVDHWRKVFAVNVDAVYYACKIVIPLMKQQGGGAIINTASISGMAADYGGTGYNATKGAVINYTRSLAIDHIRSGVRVNAICPGPVATRATDKIESMPGDIGERWKHCVPAHRFARPEEIAAVAAFLASDEASFIVGAAIPVDGGLTAHTGQPDVPFLMSLQ